VRFDNIDIEAVRVRGIRATNTPDVLTNANRADRSGAAVGSRLGVLVRGTRIPDNRLLRRSTDGKW